MAFAPPMDPHAVTELIAATAAAAVVSRLVYLNLLKRFPALFAYLVLVGLIDLTFGLLETASALYFWSYVALEPLKCVFGIVAVRELFALTFNEYPGIRSVGRWAMYSGLALALVISLVAAGFFWSDETRGRSIHLFYFEVAQRSVVFTLAFVIVAILLCLSRYPLHLSRNTLASSAFFSVLFLSEASQLLVDSVAPELFNLSVDWAYTIFVSICLLGWAAMLRPEAARAAARITVTTSQEDHLLQQLNALNQLMTRAARR